MATSVIIPARNEAATIFKIVDVFNAHAETTGRVFVGLDAATVDDTSERANRAGAIIVDTGVRGKGQVVVETLTAVHSSGMITDRVILCDADYDGLSLEHITRILYNHGGMIVGVPDFPQIDVPERVIMAWPRVSGFRSLPWALIPDDAHGYLLETQLTMRVIKNRMPLQYRMMAGLKSPFQWPLPPKREQARIRDREWGERNGVL